MSNTQLPAEVLKGIKNKALIHLQLCYTDGYVLERLEKENMPIGWKIRLKDYEAGATEYAIKLHQTQQQLDKAKELALEWFKVSIENAHMRYLLAKATFSHPKVLADEALFNEIKTFLDGTK